MLTKLNTIIYGLIFSFLLINSTVLMAIDCLNFQPSVNLVLKQPNEQQMADLIEKWKSLSCEKKYPKDIDSLKSIALLFEHLNDYSAAEKWYLKALKVHSLLHGEMHLANADGWDKLGHLYMNTGADKLAREAFLQALRIRQNLLSEKHTDFAHSLNNLAGLYYKQGDTQRAGKLFQQATAIWKEQHGEEHQHYATAVNNHAWNYLQSGNHPQAIKLFEHSIQQRKKIHGEDGHHDIANSLTGLAHALHLTGNVEKSEALLRKALVLLDHEKHGNLLWQVQHHFSQSLAAQGHTGAAIFFAKQALENLHSQRLKFDKVENDSHKAFLVDKYQLYTEIINLLMKQGRLSESHHVMEMLREEEFFDFIHRDKHSGIEHTLKPLYAGHEQDLVTRYGSINQQLGELSQYRGIVIRRLQIQHEPQLKKQQAVHKNLNDFLDELKNDFPSFDSLPEDSEHLQQLQAELVAAGPGTVALHYFLSDSGLHIILTSSTRQMAYFVALQRAIFIGKIKAFRKAVQNLTRSPVKEAKALYQQLIEPIQNDLRTLGAKTILLMTDGPLRYIPFSALYDGDKYLVENYALVMHNRMVGGLGKRSKGRKWNFTGLGLSQKVAGFSPLPSVEEELVEMSKLMPGDVHLNDAFNRQALQQALAIKRPLLHIASHFVLQPGTERDSYLVLGNGQQLSLAELRSEYDFSGINMLTLSACNTAMGFHSKGTEVESLATLARHKGAQSVFASLWYLNDEGTGEFMQRFYQIRAQEKLDKANALRRTQMEFVQGDGGVNRYSHPFYWAPFILMGDWL